MTWPPGDFVSSIAAAGDDDDDDAMDVEAPVKRRQFTAPAAALREVGWQPFFSRLLWSWEVVDHIRLMWSNEKMVVFVKLLLWPHDFIRLIILLHR
jgi:hypothetical protein